MGDVPRYASTVGFHTQAQHLQAVSPAAQFQGDQGGKFHPLTRLSPVEWRWRHPICSARYFYGKVIVGIKKSHESQKIMLTSMRNMNLYITYRNIPH